LLLLLLTKHVGTGMDLMQLWRVLLSQREPSLHLHVVLAFLVVLLLLLLLLLHHEHVSAVVAGVGPAVMPVVALRHPLASRRWWLLLLLLLLLHGRGLAVVLVVHVVLVVLVGGLVDWVLLLLFKLAVVGLLRLLWGRLLLWRGLILLRLRQRLLR
jgi:hypothetical protein